MKRKSTGFGVQGLLGCGRARMRIGSTLKMLPLRTCRLTFLLSALFLTASIVAQEERTATTLPIKREINTANGVSPCFDAPDTAISKQRENEAIARLPPIARFWLTEDVAFIISPEERCAFLHLATDEERDHFIEQFWSRRAPDPRSLDNGFKRGHYERIVIANEKFSDQLPGWQTDRGRIYVTFGPPDSIESHQSKEVWHYRHLDGVGENIELEFVDSSGTGNYRLAVQPELKEELILAPLYNLGRARRGNGTTPSEPGLIEIYIGPAPTPVVQFKDLEAMVTSRIIRNQVHFSHRIEFAKATHATTLADISVNVPSTQRPLNNAANSRTQFELFGRVSKPSGWVVETFERKISLAAQNNSGDAQLDTHFHLALAPGMYRLAIVVKDSASGDTGTLYNAFEVPAYERVATEAGQRMLWWSPVTLAQKGAQSGTRTSGFYNKFRHSFAGSSI